MERVPDDVLLKMMRFLSISDLFACRLVCTRLAELALAPDVWRHRNLPHYDGVAQRCYKCPLLGLAPCLRSMSYSIQSQQGQCHTQFLTTRCAVSQLHVSVETQGFQRKFPQIALGLGCASAVHAALVIRNQEGLGRLRSLTLRLPEDMGESDASVLLRTVASTSGLEELNVFDDFPSCTPSMSGLRRLPKSSLRYFKCKLTPQSEDFCNIILATHAATLQEVELGPKTSISASTASLLGGLPNLRKLECCTLRGLEAVAACESLTHVTLYVTGGKRAESRLRAAAEFLRRAPHLLNVHLDYDDDAHRFTAADLDLTLALGASGQCRVETLYIVNWDASRCFPRLLKALPSLPSLRDLDVMWVPEEFLLGITPDTAPSLRLLEVHSDAVCAHDFLHTDAVQRLLSLNPLLQVSVYLPEYCRDSDLCDACEQGCHRELREPGVDYNMSEEDWCPNSILIPRLKLPYYL